MKKGLLGLLVGAFSACALTGAIQSTLEGALYRPPADTVLASKVLESGVVLYDRDGVPSEGRYLKVDANTQKHIFLYGNATYDSLAVDFLESDSIYLRLPKSIFTDSIYRGTHRMYPWISEEHIIHYVPGKHARKED